MSRSGAGSHVSASARIGFLQLRPSSLIGDLSLPLTWYCSCYPRDVVDLEGLGGGHGCGKAYRSVPFTLSLSLSLSAVPNLTLT